MIFTPFHSIGAIPSETLMPFLIFRLEVADGVAVLDGPHPRGGAGGNSIASSSVVLPAPPCPTSRTLRMSLASYVFKGPPIGRMGNGPGF